MKTMTNIDFFDTKWNIISVIYKKDNPNDTISNNYSMSFLEERRKFCEEKGSNSDFILNNGWWELDEKTNILTIHNRFNKKINRKFEISQFDSKTNQITFTVVHQVNFCSLYSSFDKFILQKTS